VGVCDAEFCQLLREGVEHCVHLCSGLARSCQWCDLEGGGCHDVDGRRTGVDDGWELGLPGSDRLPVGVFGNAVRGEGKRCATHYSILMGPNGHGNHDSICARASAAQGPVQIGVLGRGGDDVVASCCHDLPLEDLICTKSILRTQCRMTASLSEATCNAYRLATSPNDAQTSGLSRLVGVGGDYTRSDFECRAAITVTLVFCDNLSGLQTVHPKTQCAFASGFAKVALNISALFMCATAEAAYSCPVFFTTRRMLFFCAKLTPAATSSQALALIE